MHPYIIPVAQQFKLHADKEKAAGAKAYMRNQFPFFGLQTPLRRDITRDRIRNERPAYAELELIVKELWALPQREYQYFAVELLASMKKEWKPDIILLFEYLVTHKSWWDTVDHAGSLLLGPYFKIHPGKIKTITGKWNRSADIWLQRSSIMFQKAYKKETDTDLLSRYILQHTSSKEFFIQKAIGWSLREYARTDPGWVKDFVSAHQLAPLSRREAMKHL